MLIFVKFFNIRGVAVDAAGNVYVADYGNNVIRKITSAGVVTTLAGYKSGGFVNATGTAAAFKNPNAVAVDATGNVYVADQGNSAVRKITAAGVVTTVAGGPSQTQLLNFPERYS
jgi:sugar lactone lactonase YvrE